MNVSVKAVCDVGKVRERNEDMILVNSDLIRDNDHISELDTGNHSIFAVSDGMGGHSGGDIASEKVCRELAIALNGLKANLEYDELYQYFLETVEDTHNSLVEQSKKEPEKRGMGATLIAVLYYGDKIYYINAGDSRLYRIRNGRLKQISKDHSLAQAAGYDRAKSHVLLNSVGGGEEVRIDFENITEIVMDDDLLLLCSDGLTDLVEDDVIEEILSVNPNPAILVNEAKKNGGVDNISVVLIHNSSDEKAEGGNEFLDLLNKYREGLEQTDGIVAQDLIKKYNLDLVKSHDLKNINGDDAEIELYSDGNITVLVSTVKVETESEGTLHHQSYYKGMK